MSHDALRLMARHGTALVAVGEDGVRCYTAPPLMPDASDVARRQMRAWGDPTGSRITIARKMYALRLGEVLPQQDISALRGVEGARMRQTYRLVAQRYGIDWRRRRYDRTDPLWGGSAQPGNQPRLGGRDLGGRGGGHGHGRHSPSWDSSTRVAAKPSPWTSPTCSGTQSCCRRRFNRPGEVMDQPHLDIERHTRRTTGELLRKERVISKMIDRIKALFQDVPPLEMGSNEPVGDWQADWELDEADAHEANVAEGAYPDVLEEGSQGRGDAP